MSKLFYYRNVKDIDDRSDYLHRWSLRLPFGWSIKLHKIVRPDMDRCEHDHPWSFIRIILWGGYTESVRGKLVKLKPWRPWAPWRVYFCAPSFRHSIRKLTKGVNWSIVLCGKNRSAWGFWTKDGWMIWYQFIEKVRKAVVWCD